LGSDADRLIPLILEAANRMSKLVKSLLDYSRVGGDPDMHRVPVDLNETFRVACQTLNFAIQDSEAVVTHEPLPTVLADRDQMHQLVQNLLSNALKYRRRDEAPRVQLQVVRRTGEWLFTLRDQGLGFEPRHAEHIFGIFKRVHGQRYSGTGIGLAICRKIVERHGGRIWAESAGPGQGAAFHFTLPETEVPPDVESGG
jgi:light-regulated signal transduction histidine kinase (bacteriophytochrome)